MKCKQGDIDLLSELGVFFIFYNLSMCLCCCVHVMSLFVCLPVDNLSVLALTLRMCYINSALS